MKFVVVVPLALISFILVFPQSAAWGQCSDAGVCIIGKKHSASGNIIGLSYSYGNSGKDSTLMFNTIRLEGTYHIFENADIHLGIPFSNQSGPAGTARGIGDLTILWNQIVMRNEGTTLRLQGGLKLATGSVNSNDLPQAYQSGLGTNDILLGATFEIKGIALASAYQITTGRSANRNTRLRRGDDLMLRAGYTHRAQDFTLGGELLAIKRIQESSVLQTAQPETFVNVPNSNQLQVNLVGRMTYTFTERFQLQVESALSLLKRDTNVDGLKRAFTLSLGVAHLL